MPKAPRMITFQGRTQSLAAWSRELGIPESTLRSRIQHLGMSIEEALGKPVDARFRLHSQPADVTPRQPPRLVRDSRGRGVARWSSLGCRRCRVFGPYGDPATLQAYNRWAAEWILSQGDITPRPGEVVGVAAVASAALDWAERTYRKHGKITSEVYGFRAALTTVVDLYGDLPAEEFRPRQLRVVQNEWVSRGLALKTCNDYLNKILRAWRHAASEELIPASLVLDLESVDPLSPGRNAARVCEPVPPASDADLEAILPHLHPDPERCRLLADLVRLQRATGMRPGEALELQAEDIDRSREPWVYRPASGGKTLHLEKPREVWIGPIGRAILRPWLEKAGEEKTRQRLFQFQARRGGGKVSVRIEYYRDCLARACRIAGVPVIRPNQIRHAKATEIQRVYEDDAAVAAILGNTPEVARQVYVDSPVTAVARRIAETLG